MSHSFHSFIHFITRSLPLLPFYSRINLCFVVVFSAFCSRVSVAFCLFLCLLACSLFLFCIPHCFLLCECFRSFDSLKLNQHWRLDFSNTSLQIAFSLKYTTHFSFSITSILMKFDFFLSINQIYEDFNCKPSK